MFTGIVEEVGRVEAAGGGGLSVGASLVLDDLGLGDSIAVSGVCLTVTRLSDSGSAWTWCPRLSGARRWAPWTLETR